MGQGLLWRGTQKSQPAQGLGRHLGRGSGVVNPGGLGAEAGRTLGGTMELVCQAHDP